MSIELTHLKEQVFPYQCPSCYEMMGDKDIVGETQYDVNRIGHSMGGLAVVFECPHCFKKSFVHKESLQYGKYDKSN